MTGEAPLIDQASTTIGNNIDSRQIKSLPTGRNYTSIVQISPGVSTQTVQHRGLRQHDRRQRLDRPRERLRHRRRRDERRRVRRPGQGAQLRVHPGGRASRPAATRPSTAARPGGIINVITKSGGNEFHGDAFVYYDNNSLQASNKHPEDSQLFSFISGYNRLDYGFDLGGFVLKDKLWFFGAYDRVQNTTKQT